MPWHTGGPGGEREALAQVVVEGLCGAQVDVDFDDDRLAFAGGVDGVAARRHRRKSERTQWSLRPRPREPRACVFGGTEQNWSGAATGMGRALRARGSAGKARVARFVTKCDGGG